MLCFLALACQESERIRPVPKEPSAPLIAADPPPGGYRTSELKVTFRAPTEEYSLWYGLNEPPNTSDRPQRGQFTVRLTRNTVVRVIVEDGMGLRWGPLEFVYKLITSPSAPFCGLVTSRSLINASQSVIVTASFSPSTALDRFYLLKDGLKEEVDRDALDEAGTYSFTAGPWPATGVHGFGCLVEGPERFENYVEVTVDADPPTASWLVASGVVRRADWPVDIALTASDALSGLANVQLCTSHGCVPPQGMGEALFQYSTAFSSGTNFAAAVTAFASDHAGNVRLLDPIVYGIEFDEPPKLARMPIAATIATEVSIANYLDGPSGPIVVEQIKRIGATAPEPSPETVVLAAGWNDFLFRQSGKTEWESFAIYQLGFSVNLLPSNHRWLVYASNATIPALNGQLVQRVDGNAYYSDWWDIPHVWFVNDIDGDGEWSEADLVCFPDEDWFGGPWTRRAMPWAWQMQVEDCKAPASTFGTQSYWVTCDTCTGPGRLFRQAREEWQRYPVYHGAAPAGAAGLAGGTEVTFPTAPAPLCIFYWDENENAVADGGEAREFTSCNAPSVNLTRRSGTLRASATDNTIEVSGMAYGGAAWLRAELFSGATLLSSHSLGKIRDEDGLGEGRLALTPDLPRVLPWVIAVTDAVSVGAPALLPPKPSIPPFVELVISVLNESGLPFTAPAGLLFQNVQGGLAGAVYSGDGQPVRFNAPAGEMPWSGFAFRDGFLSMMASAPGTDASVYLFSGTGAGIIKGQVLDSSDRPVSFATVTWDAHPYLSRVQSDASGHFSLPALGGGTLWVEGNEPGQFTSQFLWVDPYAQIGPITMWLPTFSAKPAKGLLVEAAHTKITGEVPVEVLASPPYYFAPLTEGAWVHEVQGIKRHFLLPGFLPSYETIPVTSVPMPPAVGASLRQEIVCGDRFQAIGTASSAQIDDNCWHWEVSSAYETYFLGWIEPDGGIDTTERFGSIGIEVLGAELEYVWLHDTLFGRSLRLEASGSRAEGVVAAGYYSVTLSDGTMLWDGSGRPAEVRVAPGNFLTYRLQKP